MRFHLWQRSIHAGRSNASRLLEKSPTGCNCLRMVVYKRVVVVVIVFFKSGDHLFDPFSCLVILKPSRVPSTMQRLRVIRSSPPRADCPLILYTSGCRGLSVHSLLYFFMPAEWGAEQGPYLLFHALATTRRCHPISTPRADDATTLLRACFWRETCVRIRDGAVK